MLGEQAVNCLITSPEPGARVKTGGLRVEGVAYVGGPRTIERVEVSTDDGKTWSVATLGADAGPWSWRFWDAEVEIGPATTELVARAWDSAGQTQPPDPSHVWNFKGYMNNAWARVRVTV